MKSVLVPRSGPPPRSVEGVDPARQRLQGHAALVLACDEAGNTTSRPVSIRKSW